jgi:hypothetical protein
MISAITSAHQAEPPVAAQPKAGSSATSSQKPAQTASSSSIPTDTVRLSNAAQASIKESLETSVQTAREAAGGDHQAQRLLAKEAAGH